jgi:hypothetical protein
VRMKTGRSRAGRSRPCSRNHRSSPPASELGPGPALARAPGPAVAGPRPAPASGRARR